MKIIQKTVPDNFNYFLFGDNHEGSDAQYIKGVQKLFQVLESPWNGIKPEHNYGWHHGDHIEAIMVDDPRFDFTSKTPIPLQQNEAFINRWLPIASHLIGMSEGNHPWKLHRFGRLTEAACYGLCIEYGTWTSKVIFTDTAGQVIMKAYHTHGRKTITSTADDIGRRRTNMELILKRHLREKAGDCLIMSKGHTHRLLVCQPRPALYMTDDGETVVQGYTHPNLVEKHFAFDRERPPIATGGGYIHPDDRWYVNSGAFYRTFGEGASGYPEANEYDPMELGFAIVEVRDRAVQRIVPIVL